LALKRNPFSILCFLVVLLWTTLYFVPLAHGEVLLEDTVWEGEVLIEENILVPRGITLTIRKNTVVNVVPADSTRTDPEYMTSMTEITVRGTLLVEGDPSGPVVIQLNPSAAENNAWSGLIIDGGSARIRSCTISDAETGIWILAGSLDLRDSTLIRNRYGMVAQGEAVRVNAANTRITGNEYGLLALNGASVAQDGAAIVENSRMNVHAVPADSPEFTLPRYEAVPAGKPLEPVGEVLMGDTIWQGYIRVSNRLRVPVDSRLIILPGTVVEFAKNDTNGDGIGENGLMLQGVLIAKGTADQPIVFRSAEADRKPGDWDAINIINSDGARNIIEYCQVEDAYRGLHFHFSNVAVQHCVFRHNLRGVQFQESTVDLRQNHFYANSSAIQARDSEIIFIGNQVVDNIFGANFLRAHLTIQDNRFGSNLDFGLKVREGYPLVSGNLFDHNRFGLMFSDNTYGRIERNMLLRNSETGLSMRTGTNMEISGNFVQANGLSGISVRDSMAVISDNHITENGERGIGLIAFQGPVTRNTLLNNGLYAIALEDATDVAAPGNWYGRDDIGPIIYDRDDDPGRGRLDYSPVAQEPPSFAWPADQVPLDLNWSGRIMVPHTVSVPAGVTLAVLPGTGVLFAEEADLYVRGRLLALGKADQRIRFTAAEGREAETWGEIRIEYSEGSRISNCDIEYATWGIHSHFTSLPVIGCSFRHNGGGIRFRSGPLLIKNSMFTDNGIGIRAYLGTAEIADNIITRNAKGIFVREQGGGLLIRNNNISDNTDYNIWVGDFNTEDIQAAGNWWGKDDPADTFFDARREPGIGTVLYEPVLKEPLDIGIVDPEQH